jgi:hypothetical protein
MKPIIPKIASRPQHTVIPVESNIIMSNVFTHLTTTNGRPTQRRNFTPAVCEAWMKESIRYAATDSRSKDITDLLLAMKDKPPSPITVFMARFREVAGLMLSEPTYVKDAGQDLKSALLATDAWTTTKVVNPSMGYARDWMEFKPVDPGKYSPFLVPGFDGMRDPLEDVGADANMDDSTIAAKSTVSAWMRAIALTAMMMDRHAYSAAIIPEGKTVLRKDPKEPLFGPIESVLSQQSLIVAIPLLYICQGIGKILKDSQPLWDFSRDLAYLAYPKERPLLEAYDNLRNMVRDKIPLHPEYESIGNLTGDVSVTTYFGTGKAIICDKTASAFLPLTTRPASSQQPALAQAYLAHAAADFTRLDAANPGWAEGWLAGVTPNLSSTYRRTAAAIPPGMATLTTVMDMLVRFAEYVELWSDITRSLGWGSAISTQPVEIQAAGADFVLCDGDYYSSTPYAVLAGLRPCFSLGNTKAAGLNRRFQSDFNTGPNPYEAEPLLSPNGGMSERVEQVWSTLACDSYQTASDGADVMQRYYMPPGMLMGEQDVEVQEVGDDATIDPIGKMVVDWYRSRSNVGYVRHWYSDAHDTQSRRAPNGLVMVTDWDVVVQGDDGTIQGLMIDAYGSGNVDSNPKAFAYRDRFNDRIPVRLARSQEVYILDERGVYQFAQTFDGAVMFDDTLDANVDASVLDAAREMLKVVEPRLLPPGAAEATAPQDTE